MTISAKISQANDLLQVVEVESSEQSYGVDAIQEALNAVNELPIDFKKGVVISHRGAIWMHSALAHHFHVAAFVAHFDPRVGGAVVSQSHKQGVAAGDVLEIPKPE